MWVLLIPILVLVVLAFLATAVFAGVFWVLSAGWPWLLIGLGAWLFWHEDGRHYRRRAWRDRREPVAHQPGPAPAAAARKPDQRAPRPLRRAELPIDVQVKVEQIRRKVDVLLGFADRFPPFSQDLYLVRQTAGEYLPRTIDAYLALSKEAAEKPLSADGRTAHQELKAQLDLLDAKLDEIAQDLQRQDADRLLANRRFLEARFGLRDKADVA